METQNDVLVGVLAAMPSYLGERCACKQRCAKYMARNSYR